MARSATLEYAKFSSSAPRSSDGRSRLFGGFFSRERVRGQNLHAFICRQDTWTRPPLVQHVGLRKPRETGRLSQPLKTTVRKSPETGCSSQTLAGKPEPTPVNQAALKGSQMRTTILPLAWFDSIASCASRISSN